MKRNVLRRALALLLPVLMAWAGPARAADIGTGDLRKIAFALVSSAENSTIHYETQYGYIEDIGDGRGYTCGIVGFTSGTGDLLMVVSRYAQSKPDAPLAAYLPALRAVNGTAAHDGLDDAFCLAWQTAASDTEMIEAQNALVNSLYMIPALRYAALDGLSPLGQFIYYDAIVMHGADGLISIRGAALQKESPPSEDGDEATYLAAFLEARAVEMKKEAAHSDLSRLIAQKNFLDEGNFDLALPLQWTMYGDLFTLTQEDLETLP
jgi:chitosanase